MADLVYLAFIALSVGLLGLVYRASQPGPRASKAFLATLLLAFAVPLALLGAFRHSFWAQVTALAALGTQGLVSFVLLRRNDRAGCDTKVVEG